jgi:uncharacterized membrane protein YkvA (DUF1232 family)
VEVSTIDLGWIGPCEVLVHRSGAIGRNVPDVGIVESVVATISPRRIAAFHALWRVMSQRRRPGAPGVGDQLRSLPRMIISALSGRYPQLSRGRLGLLVLALAYLVSPVDLLPEAFLALLGIGDDVIVALWLGGAVLVETDRFLEWERSRPTVIDMPA